MDFGDERVFVLCTGHKRSQTEVFETFGLNFCSQISPEVRVATPFIEEDGLCKTNSSMVVLRLKPLPY